MLQRRLGLYLSAAKTANDALAASRDERDRRLVVRRWRIRGDGRGGDGSPRAGRVDVDVVAGPDPRREGRRYERACRGTHDEGCAR